MMFFYYFLISFSILGFGLVLNKFMEMKFKNLGSIGFVGIFFLILISYISSIFVPHSYFFNLIILLSGVIFFIYFFLKKNIDKKDLFCHFLVFFVLLIFILNGKNHDDFPYYHFPYTYLLTQESHPIGLGLLNNGFRNPSSLFFFNSLFYLPKIDVYLFHIGSVFFLGYANVFFIKNIFDKDLFNRFRFYNLLNLFCLVFFNIFFSRLAEYGTDRAGQILISLIVINLLLLINKNSEQSEKNFEIFNSIVIFGCLAISLKPFFLLYTSLILLFFFYKDLLVFLKKFFVSKLFFVSFTFIAISFFVTFINSSCFIFPASFSCFENLAWSLSKSEVTDVKIWYELWAKAGATPSIVVENRNDYLTNLNWLSNWVNIYFFNKVSDYLLSLIFISTIFYLSLKSKIELNIFTRKYFFLYIFLIFYLLEWFLNHPSLRYGGYHLFMLIFFIPLALALDKYQINFKHFRKKSLILITITLIIFFGRNMTRLYNEFTLYNYNILKNTNYKFINGKKSHYRYEEMIKKKNFNFDIKNFLGKEFLVIKKSH
jgi:hypothetical protein